MRRNPALVSLMSVIVLGGCATTAPPETASTPSTPATVSAPVTTDASSARPSSASAKPTSGSASATPSTSGDKLPAGYTYGILTRLTQVGERWSVVIDPVTMCTFPSTDPNCSDLTEPPPNDYEIRNLSTKTYAVPLASGATLKVIADSGQPGDFVTLPLAEKTWATGADQAEMIVTYETNAAGEVSAVTQWWHP